MRFYPPFRHSINENRHSINESRGSFRYVVKYDEIIISLKDVKIMYYLKLVA
jgi:hypothetical protein